jgi:hypothetical protein
MMGPMSDALRRGIRTLIQVLLAAAAGLSLLVSADVLSTGQATKAGAVCAFVAAIVSVVQNTLEDNTSFPALLKGPASSGEHPAP